MTTFLILMIIFWSIITALASSIIGIALRRRKKKDHSETLPAYILKQQKVFYVTMPGTFSADDPLFNQITIDGEEPPEPIPFTSTLRFKFAGSFIAVIFALIIYFMIIR